MRNYIPSAAAGSIAKGGALLGSLSDQSVDTPEEIPTAYPQVQPMKAALYFDSAEGFGQWRIFVSGRADRNLRETKKKDANLFRITLKKIKYSFVFALISARYLTEEFPVESYRTAISRMTTKNA